MNNRNFLIKGLFFLSLSMLMFTGCEEGDDEPDAEYVGKWESAVYLSYDLSTGDLISEQMIFTFTNSTFIDKIYQSSDTSVTTHDELSEAAGMKGNMEATDTEFDVEVTGISVSGGAFTEKSSDPLTFATIWNASLGNLLDESFTAEYVIANDVMVLSLPVTMSGTSVTQTLTLYKVEE